MSNALLTNNRLCSYATDYGRLSTPIQYPGLLHTGLAGGIESTSFQRWKGRHPTVPEPCSPLNGGPPLGGRRGTLIRKQLKAGYSNCPDERRKSTSAPLPAAETPISLSIDLLVFDPPYYDYIIYDELAEPFRAWNPSHQMSGETLQSAAASESGDFGRRFADCLRPALAARDNRYPVVFTYHSSKSAAWEEIGVALDQLELRITAMWPVRSDGHMGHHSRPGNCEWDIVVVCRPSQETQPTSLPSATEFWKPHFGDLGVGKRRSHELRFGVSNGLLAIRQADR